MIRNNISMTIKVLKAMHDNPAKDTIDFNSPIQRKSGMWDEMRKSLLIHSILMSSIFSVPTVYFRKDMVGDKKYQYSVIDGIQRITTIFSYVDNEFCLSEVPPVTIDGATYEVSGLYFSDLPQDCQQEIIRFKMRIEAFEPEDDDSEFYVNDTIEEVFSRINSAVPLTSAQLCKAKVGTSTAILINELLGSKFFTESCNFSKAQIKASDDQRSLLQGMMLLDRNYVAGFELKDFSETSIMEYAKNIKGNYSDKQENFLRSTIQYLTDAFPEKNKNLRKISVPMLIYMADAAEDKEIKPMYFRQWFEFFTDEDSLFEDYKTFCSSGSTKSDKVDGRLAIMAKSFAAYHEVDIPDELLEMVTKVEKILEERRAEEVVMSDGESDVENPESNATDFPEVDADSENNPDTENVVEETDSDENSEADVEDVSGEEEVGEEPTEAAI